jgi:hypothetical protein
MVWPGAARADAVLFSEPVRMGVAFGQRPVWLRALKSNSQQSLFSSLSPSETNRDARSLDQNCVISQSEETRRDYFTKRQCVSLLFCIFCRFNGSSLFAHFRAVRLGQSMGINKPWYHKRMKLQ